MSDIPRMTWIVPLRRRLQFTTNLLPTLFRFAERKDHEVIVILDKCDYRTEAARLGIDVEEAARQDAIDRQKVYRWFDSHADLVVAHNIRMLDSYGSPALHTGGQRTAAALNLGIERASTPWMVGIGDEDLCLQPGWDRALWQALDGRDPLKYVSTLSMVMPKVFEGDPLPPATSGWVKNSVNSQLSFPVRPEHASTKGARISHAMFCAFTNVASSPDVLEERCAERLACHWVPLLMHRDLLGKVGGWPTREDSAYSFDIALDDDLAKLGVVKRMPRDAFALHTKHALYLDEETDRTWASPEWLDDVGREAVIL